MRTEETPRKLPLILAAGIILCAIWAGSASAAIPWDRESIRDIAKVPIQDGGRIKPLDTYARFTLLRFNGKRTFTLESGERTSALEWLLDVLFAGADTLDYRHFSIDSSEVLTAIGVDARKERARYSYKELLPGRDKLFMLAQQYSVIEDKNRDTTQRQLLFLAQNVREFEMLNRTMDFARLQLDTGGDAQLQALFGTQAPLTASAVLGHLPELKASSAANAQAQALLERLQNALLQSTLLAIFPPADGSVRDWLKPADVLTRGMAGTLEENSLRYLAALEQVSRSSQDPNALRDAAAAWLAQASGLARIRNEYGKIPTEVFYYRANLLFYAQWLFVLSFVLVSLCWLAPNLRAFSYGSLAVIVLSLAMLIGGITLRCIIRGRPPISTLYETILFITAVIVLVCLLMEYMNRQRIALSLAAILGMVGLFLAYKYETNDAKDTMPALVAVLNTNFWLSTHVTTVTTGYAAGLLAGFLGCTYVVAALFGYTTKHRDSSRALSRMIYGTLCFGVFFALVGTVLGGIWANYSWGRFWGWDPKENGALLIVLCNLGILHARMGGYLRELGIAMGAIFGGMVVAFSWWGVNLLGVGLHSYGFTSGIWGALRIFWLSQALFLAAGVGVFLRGVFSAHASNERRPESNR